MNKSLHEADILFSQILELREDYPEDVHVIVAPPAIYLSRYGKQLKGVDGIRLSAQNCAHKNEGAFTGEVSAEMLKSIRVKYAIIGHSERRHIFNESDELLASKVQSAVHYDLHPIFCVGEKLEDRNAGKHFEVVQRQLENGLFHLDKEAFAKVIVAYEPVWAIGTGETATPEQAEEMHAKIRQMIAETYDYNTAEETTILYGGSCNPDNAEVLFEQPNVDGGLIGGASLKATSFAAIIKAAGVSVS